jgi:carbon monoxide dehydrogenase subunit G
VDAVEADLHIAAAPQEVWDFAMDPWRSLEWVTIAQAVTHADDGPLEVGYRMEQRLSLRGAPFVVRWELVEADEPRYARWEGRGPARSQATIEDVLEPEDGGTRFRYRNAFRTPFGALGAVASRALVGGVARREACASLERLKAALETGTQPLAVAA